MLKRLLAATLAAAIVVLSPGLEPWRLLAAGPTAAGAAPVGAWAPALQTYFAQFESAASVPSAALRPYHGLDLSAKKGRAQALPLLLALRSLEVDPAEFLATPSQSQTFVLEWALASRASSTEDLVQEIASQLGSSSQLSPTLQSIADSALPKAEREIVGQGVAFSAGRKLPPETRRRWIDSQVLWNTLSGARDIRSEITILKKEAARVLDLKEKPARAQDWVVPRIPGDGFSEKIRAAKRSFKYALLMLRVPRVALQRAAFNWRNKALNLPSAKDEDPPRAGLKGISVSVEHLQFAVARQIETVQRIDETSPLGKAWYRRQVERRIRYTDESAVRLATVTAPYTFEDHWGPEKTDRAWFHIPHHPALRLIKESEGSYVIKAHFGTDIDNDGALEVVKASIERYWKGKVSIDGRRVALRTEVKITKAKAGKRIPKGLLRLKDGFDSIASAGAAGMTLGRNLDFYTPAHEFGHVLGLTDEYREWFVPETASSLVWQDPRSLMGSRTGKLLPRHRQLAVELLQGRTPKPADLAAAQTKARVLEVLHRSASITGAAALAYWTNYRYATATLRKSLGLEGDYSLLNRINLYWLNDFMTVPFAAAAAFLLSLLWIRNGGAEITRREMRRAVLVASVFIAGSSAVQELGQKTSGGYDPIDLAIFITGPAIAWLMAKLVWWPKQSAKPDNGGYALTLLMLVGGVASAMSVMANYIPGAMLGFGALLALFPVVFLHLETRSSGSPGPEKSGPTDRK